MLSQVVIKKHTHNSFGAFFQQATSPNIAERESVLYCTWPGLTKPAGEAPAISPEGMGEWGDVSAGAHHYEDSTKSPSPFPIYK